MPLFPPRVIGPISPCNTFVLVKGQIPGNDVRVFADGSLVASGLATAVEQFFDLIPGIVLLPNQLIKAQQVNTAGEVSIDHPDGIEVMPTPALRDMGRIAWLSRLHECGRCLMIGGAYPGSRIKIVDTAGMTISERVVYGTVARMSLNRHILSASEILTAQHEACGVFGPDVLSPTSTSFMNADLPPPVIDEPLFACMRRVYVRGVFEGAAVRLTRTMGSDLTGCFDAPGLYFALAPGEELHEGEEISALQGYPDCERWSLPSPPRPVRPASEVPTPRILPPPCVGTDRIVIENLVPDAIVHIFANGVEIGFTAASDITDVFLILPSMLPSGVDVILLTATQELCGFPSGVSDGVPVKPGPVDVSRLKMGELFECVTTVQLDNTVPNALIIVQSGFRGQLARTTATSDVTLVRVPALKRGETIVASQHTCGASSSTAMAGVISYFNELPTPTVRGPVLANDDSIEIINILRGAIVEVYVNDALVVSTVGIARESFTTDTTIVALYHPIRKDDRISAIQRLCSMESNPSPEVTAQECIGQIRLGLKSILAEGETNHMGSLVVQAGWARRLFRNFNIEVKIIDKEVLDIPRFRAFNHMDTGLISELSRYRNNLSVGDIACFMIPDGDTGGAQLRGSSHALIWWGSDLVFHSWFLAHEVGHVFGLPHAPMGEVDRVMHPGGFPPASPSVTIGLNGDELGIIQRNTRFLHPC